jgi:hypothetical protein
VQTSWEVVIATVCVWLIEKIKNSPIPWINQGAGWINRIFAIVVAAIAAAGITWQFDAGAGTLDPCWADLAQSLHLYSSHLQAVRLAAVNVAVIQIQ